MTDITKNDRLKAHERIMVQNRDLWKKRKKALSISILKRQSISVFPDVSTSDPIRMRSR